MMACKIGCTLFDVSIPWPLGANAFISRSQKPSSKSMSVLIWSGCRACTYRNFLSFLDRASMFPILRAFWTSRSWLRVLGITMLTYLAFWNTESWNMISDWRVDGYVTYKPSYNDHCPNQSRSISAKCLKWNTPAFQKGPERFFCSGLSSIRELETLFLCGNYAWLFRAIIPCEAASIINHFTLKAWAVAGTGSISRSRMKASSGKSAKALASLAIMV